MTPLERLYAEQWPTGTFGHARPLQSPPPRPTGPIRPWKREEQDRHFAELAAALGESILRIVDRPAQAA